MHSTTTMTGGLRDKSPNSNSVCHLDSILELKERLESENQQLKKQLRAKEAEFQKTTALLQQKVQLLDLQVQESEEREQNLKKVQEKMIAAFNPNGGSTNGKDAQVTQQAEIIKDLQIQNEMQQIEIKDLKQRITDLQHSSENHVAQIEDLTQKLKSTEEKFQNQKQDFDNQSLTYQVRIKELEVILEQSENEKVRMQQEIEGNHFRYRQSMEYFSNEKKKVRNSSGKKIRDYDSEVERLKSSHEILVSSLKSEHEREKRHLEQQLEKLEQALKLSHLKQENSTKQSVSDLQTKYLKEIQDLNSSLTQFKSQTEQELSQLRKERDDLTKKCEYYERDIAKLKAKVKSAKEETQKLKSESNQSKINDRNGEEKAQEEINKHKAKVKTLKQQVSKLENAEKKLKNMLIDKENEHEQEMIEIKRILNAERKKFKELQESSMQFQENYEKLQEDIYKQVKEKDKKLSFMSTTIKDLESQLNSQISYNQTMANIGVLNKTAMNPNSTAFMNNQLPTAAQLRANVQHMDYSPEAHREMLGLTNEILGNCTQQTSVMLATKILELGQEIVCGACGKKYGVKTFVEHMDQCNPKSQFENRQFISKDNLISTHELASSYYGDESYKNKGGNLLKSSIQSSLSSLQHNPLISEDNQQKGFLFDSNVSSVQYQSSSNEEHQQNEVVPGMIVSSMNNFQNPRRTMDGNYSHQQQFDLRKSQEKLYNQGHYQQQLQQQQNYRQSCPNCLDSQTTNDIKQKIHHSERVILRLNQTFEELKSERDSLQIELDKTILELKRTKIELALCEERKSESELCYKNEIKYLIDKLLKTKNKLTKERDNNQRQATFESDVEYDEYDHDNPQNQRELNQNQTNDSSFVSTVFVNQMKHHQRLPLQHSNSNNNLTGANYMKNIINQSKYSFVDSQPTLTLKPGMIKNSNSTAKLSQNPKRASISSQNNYNQQANRTKIIQEMEQKALKAIKDQQQHQWSGDNSCIINMEQKSMVNNYHRDISSNNKHNSNNNTYNNRRVSYGGPSQGQQQKLNIQMANINNKASQKSLYSNQITENSQRSMINENMNQQRNQNQGFKRSNQPQYTSDSENLSPSHWDN